MAIAISNVHPQFPQLSLGNVEAKLVKLTYSGTYATGGDSLTPALLGMSQILAVQLLPDAATAAIAGFTFQYNYSTQKVMAFDEGAVADAPLTELNNASADLAGGVVRALVIGVI